MVAADRTSPVGHPPAGFPAPPLVLDLKEAGSAPPGLVGGKALNLGRLLAAGFTVPPGFCLTTKAYELAAPARLGAIAAELDAEIDGAAPPSAAVRPFARHARDLLAAAPVPPDVAAALRTAYAALGDAPGDEPAVAVRSSATAEDLPFASFAGQQDSYLNVVGAEAVIDSVRQCWASLWSERAVAYRSANGISHHDVGLAVVVQRYVEAATAGVLFTANPVTGTRTETVIDASPGPGQAVVSGAVNPDHFVLDTATAWVQLRAPGGAEPGRPPSLSDAQLSRLTASGDAVQRLFGTPQDIEWLIDAARQALADPVAADHHAVPAGGPDLQRSGGHGLGGRRNPCVPLRHPAAGPHPPDHAAGTRRPRRHAQREGTLDVRQPRAADVHRPDAGPAQQVRPPLSAPVPAPGGRPVREGYPGAAGRPKIPAHQALPEVPGQTRSLRPRRRRDKAPPTRRAFAGCSRCCPHCSGQRSGPGRNCGGPRSTGNGSRLNWRCPHPPPRSSGWTTPNTAWTGWSTA